MKNRSKTVIRRLTDGGLILGGAVLMGVGTHVFMEPAQIAPGGAMGLALLVNHLTELPVGALTLAFNVPLLILAWFYLSHRFAVTTAVVSTICSAVLDLAVTPLCPVYAGDRLLSSLYGGILGILFDLGERFRNGYGRITVCLAAAGLITAELLNLHMDTGTAGVLITINWVFLPLILQDNGKGRNMKKKEKNFFESRVTEYKTNADLDWGDD